MVGQALHELPGRARAAQFILGLDVQDGARVALHGVVGPDAAHLAVGVGEALLEALLGA